MLRGVTDGSETLVVGSLRSVHCSTSSTLDAYILAESCLTAAELCIESQRLDELLLHVHGVRPV